MVRAGLEVLACLFWLVAVLSSDCDGTACVWLNQMRCTVTPKRGGFSGSMHSHKTGTGPACQNTSEVHVSTPELNTDESRVSYGIGRQMGEQLRQNPPPGTSIEAVMAGLRDAFTGAPSAVEPEQLNASFAVIRERMEAEAAEQAKKAAQAGVEFLQENAKKDGVTVLESGLQYEVLTAGEGDKPGRDSTVRTHYHGTLIDGSVFDSSYERGQPAEFPVSGVIAGWTEALQLMPTGSKWRLYVPSELAYGGQSVGSIPAHSTLVFDVELLDIL